MFSQAFVTLVLLGAVNALPAAQPKSSPSSTGPHGGPPGQSSQRGEKTLADFDNLKPTAADAVKSIGVYGNLYYQGFGVLGAGDHDSGSDGVTPESAPNVAAYGLHSELEGPYKISADYEGSGIDDFDLSSLYFSCAAITEDSEASLPAACTIRATGYDGSGHSVVSQEFEYNARRLSSPMEHVQFGMGFSHVKEIQFETLTDGDEVVATLFDDVKYTVYKKSQADDHHH